MVIEEQILLSPKQLPHTPVLAQGVSLFNRKVFLGDAIFCALQIASFMSLHILFIPTIRMTFLGPKARAATLLPAPSMLTSFPLMVTALHILS